MLRIILITLFFLASLLCVFKAPQFHLWYVQILVTEFSWVFIFLVAIILFLLKGNGKFQHITTLLGIISIIFYLLPLIGSYRISTSLQDELKRSFGSKSIKEEKVFDVIQLFGLKREKNILPQTLIYDAKNNLSLDFYSSDLPRPRPCIIVVHGGSWSGGDSKQLPELNSHLASKGYHVVSINYRLAPTYKSPAPTEDILKTIEYLSENSSKLKIDSNRFVLLGRSAGAQIVLATAYSLHTKNIAGVISFYGPADMIWGYRHPSSKLIMDSKKVMEDFLGGTYQQVPDQYRLSSAVEVVSNRSIPTLLIHGENDPLVAYEHSRRLNVKLEETKVPHYLLAMPWATHGCDYTLNGPSGQLSTFAVDYFLENILK